MKPAHNIEMLVCINDLQLLRNCDEEALGSFIKFVKDYKDRITHLVLNGDILDMEQANRYGYEYSMSGTMADELLAGKWLISTLSELLPSSEKVFVAGNHDARWSAYIANKFDGIENWIKTFEEMFEFKRLGWQYIPYGSGHYYKWHDRIFWHGHRAGARSNIPKMELEATGLISVTTAHVNRNMYHEARDAMGRLASGITHGGFSKDNLHFVKAANSSWSQGFGIYYHSKEIGEQAYSVAIKHGVPKFIWEGKTYDGTGYSIREEMGFERVKPREVKLKQYGNIVVFPKN